MTEERCVLPVSCPSHHAREAHQAGLVVQVGDLIQDWRRINVAMTRARSKLIICGSRTTLERAENLEPLFKLVDERGWTVQL